MNGNPNMQPSLYQRYEPSDTVGSFTLPVRGWKWWQLVGVGYSLAANSEEAIRIIVNDTNGNGVLGVSSKYHLAAASQGLIHAAVNLPLNEEVDLSGGIAVLPTKIIDGGCVQLPLPNIEWQRDMDIVVACVDAASTLSGMFFILKGQRVGDGS